MSRAIYFVDKRFEQRSIQQNLSSWVRNEIRQWGFKEALIETKRFFSHKQAHPMAPQAQVTQTLQNNEIEDEYVFLQSTYKKRQVVHN